MTIVQNIVSKSKVDQAGAVLRNRSSSNAELQRAMEILSDWRVMHLYPINTFQATLRKKLKSIGSKKALVAQRLKRTPSIQRKLQRFPEMKLSRMQDIGGLRAVVDTIAQVRKLEDDYKNGKFNHKLVRSDNYLDNPKDSGYRGIHLVYQYQNNTPYDGLKIELQIRTKLQHAWATAVETMETFTQTALKSSQGPDEWLEFFSLVGSAFALFEGTNKLPQHESLTSRQIFAAVKGAEKRLKVIDKLNAYTVATRALNDSDDEKRGRKGHFHLIKLNPVSMEVHIRSFGKIDLVQANEEYTRIEKEILASKNGSQVVLVQNISLENLRKAYPNYFLDTHEFIKKMKQIVLMT